jgi:hypothetical protein
VFSGGTYQEVARWLRNFLTAHAKRVDPRVEISLEDDDHREGKSYGVRLRLGQRLGPVLELSFREVADNRGSLAWCTRLAERTRQLAREIAAGQGAVDARSG